MSLVACGEGSGAWRTRPEIRLRTAGSVSSVVLANMTALERIYSVYKVARGVQLDAPVTAPDRHAKKG